MTTTTDRIEKRKVLEAPIARVWRAISDAREFGSWFGVEFDGPFVEGERLTGRIVPTKVDPEVAKLQEPHTGAKVEIWVTRIEPMRLFSFEWHPFAVEKSANYGAEPRTVVSFELKEDGSKTHLTITESGFDKLPIERRAKAFAANDGGWTHQMSLVTKYLERAT